MQKIDTNQLSWKTRTSPTGKFSRSEKKISEELGRDPNSTDLNERHPFDVDITKIPPGASSCPYHSHSAQWEFYHVIGGTGSVRHQDGTLAIREGDAFLFKPHEPHQIVNDGADDLLFYVIADNPIGESCYYPDSDKWAVKSPEYRLIRSGPLDYYDREE